MLLRIPYLVRILSFLVASLVAVPVLSQTTFVVNSTDDPGDGVCDVAHCTLAEAINAANVTAASDTVWFEIPGEGPFTIQPIKPLPDIMSPLIIDGYSQPGTLPASDDAPALLLVEIDGQNAAGDAHGLLIFGDETVIRGLAINRFPRGGIYINGSRNEILGCHIGT
ncbi:MAG: CSLREA domain-containing protein, partial [Rhodothermia bacterium]